MSLSTIEWEAAQWVAIASVEASRVASFSLRVFAETHLGGVATASCIISFIHNARHHCNIEAVSKDSRYNISSLSSTRPKAPTIPLQLFPLLSLRKPCLPRPASGFEASRKARSIKADLAGSFPPGRNLHRYPSHLFFRRFEFRRRTSYSPHQERQELPQASSASVKENCCHPADAPSPTVA